MKAKRKLIQKKRKAKWNLKMTMNKTKKIANTRNFNPKMIKKMTKNIPSKKANRKNR